MKHWEKAIDYKWRAGASHAFLLHLNVDDLVLDEAKCWFETIPEYLMSSTVAKDAKFIAFFARGQGVRFATGKMREEFFALLEAAHKEKDASGENAAVERFKKEETEVEYVIRLFTEMLEVSWADYAKLMESRGKTVELPGKSKEKRPFFVAVISHLETITPPQACESSCAVDRDSLVAILEWAKSKKIREAGNAIVLLTDSLQSVARQFRAETSGITPLKIHLPDHDDRAGAVRILRKKYPAAEGDLEERILADLSSGMSLFTISNLVQEAYLRKTPLTPDWIFKAKKKFVDEKCEGLLKILQPMWGLEAIGGLEEKKQYIQEVVAAMRRGDFLAVPMGIMLIGAPGTGKTVFAEALAHEAGIPFIRMKSIRNPYVGVSEMNLEFALEVIVAVSPAVVWEDEADQKMQSRDIAWDNTGVNNRLQSRLHEFMSDTDLRGRVLWMSASNRPDLIDPAQLREGRSDKLIPFFPPGPEERGKILLSILEKVKIQAAERRQEFRHAITEEFSREFGYMSHRHKTNEGIELCDGMHRKDNEDGEDIVQLTGAQIEAIVQDAYATKGEDEILGPEHVRKAHDAFIPTPDKVEQQERMTKLALLYCNNERFLTGKWKAEAQRLRKQQLNADKPQRTVLRS